MAIASMGVVLSISTAIGRFSDNLAKSGVFMIMPGESAEAAKKIIDSNAAAIARTAVVDKAESARLLRRWLRAGDALNNYIPQMIQVEVKSRDALAVIEKNAYADKVRFVAAAAATPDRRVGIRIILISAMVGAMVLAALIACIIHSVGNIISIHSRDIGILEQVGATTAYIARQMQMAMLKITMPAATAGLAAGWLMMIAVSGLSRGSRTGLLANIGLSAADWALTAALAAIIVVITAAVTRRTTLKILG